MKRSKELNAITKAIDAYLKKHNNDASFIGSIVAFNKDYEVVDDIILGYGEKDTVKIQLDSLKKELKKDKEEFINW